MFRLWFLPPSLKDKDKRENISFKSPPTSTPCNVSVGFQQEPVVTNTLSQHQWFAAFRPKPDVHSVRYAMHREGGGGGRGGISALTWRFYASCVSVVFSYYSYFIFYRPDNMNTSTNMNTDTKPSRTHAPLPPSRQLKPPLLSSKKNKGLSRKRRMRLS